MPTAAATYNRDTTTSDITICSTPVGEAPVTDYCVLELPGESKIFQYSKVHCHSPWLA